MRRRTSLTLIAFVCLCASSIYAQQPRTTTIYVSDLQLSQSPDADQLKIAQAVSSVLELRLSAMKDVQVVRDEPQCEQKRVELASTSRQREEASSQIALAEQPVYHVKSSLKLFTRTGTASSRIVELILDYDLLKFVRCKESSIIRRSEPVSIKSAFTTILQMGDLLQVALEEELAPKKIKVDFVEITGPDQSQPLRNQLKTAILTKLTDQEDLQVRSFTEKPTSGSDYVVTGGFTNDGRQANFVVESANGNRYPFPLDLPLNTNNPEDTARFFEKVATLVLGYIRSDRDPANLSDADVAAIVTRARAALCKEQNCVPQPALAITDLSRLRDLNRATSEALALLGEAYALREEYQKAAEAYTQAWTRSPSNTADNVALSYLLSAAEASYKGQSYVQAGEQYDKYIDLQSKKESPSLAPNIFLQAARSYRFANEPIKALERTLQGLTEFAGSPELDKELSEILQNISSATLFSGYETLIKYRNVPKVAAKISEVKDILAENWAGEALELVLDKRFQDAEKYLRRIESLPVASLNKEGQMIYQMARAVWQRDAQKDFAGAISSLQPYTTEQTELGMLARYLLAETLYKRARSSSTPDKADYERASTLVRQISEKVPDERILRLLVKSNHELGKDNESRQLLDRLIARVAAAADAQFALAVLCVDYIGDLVCGDKAISESGPRYRNDRELVLRRVSIHIFWAQYDNALTQLNSANSSADSSLLEVELFYRVWTELALSRPQAQASFDAWLSKMESLRREGETTEWLFTTASRALEAEQALKPAAKELLKRMIAAMSDPKQPLPTADFR